MEGASYREEVSTNDTQKKIERASADGANGTQIVRRQRTGPVEEYVLNVPGKNAGGFARMILRTLAKGNPRF
jgi:hypothetical protein